MFKVVNNFLDKTEFKQIQKIMTSQDFPWYYNKYISSSTDAKHLYFFTHNYYLNNEIQSSFYKMWKNLIQKLECKSLLRIKAGLYPSHSKVRYNNFHKDFPFKHKGCLFYINSNNGPTTIEKKSILPKENRAVFFDPSLPHRSSLCSDQQVRITVNFNYL